MEAGPLARVGEALADFCERYFPDAFVFALCAVIIVFLGGLVLGEKPLKLVQVFGEGFWVLIPFTMQMALIIIGGFVVASSPPVARLIEWLAGVPKTPRGAVAFVALLAMLTSLLSWGLSLIFTGLLVREVVRRVPRIDYRAIGAAAYLGLGAVWALGLSSSAALLQNTKGSIPPALLHITGVIPLTQTIFLWQSLLTAAILIGLSVAVAYFSCPSPQKAKTAEDMGITFEPLEVTVDKPKTPADRLESSPVLSVLIAILMIAYIVYLFMQKGAMAATDLNTFNFIFLTAGILLHWRPGAFLKAVGKSVPATAGVIIQFPFYGGIFGLIAKTAINPFPVRSLREAHLAWNLPHPGGDLFGRARDLCSLRRRQVGGGGALHHDGGQHLARAPGVGGADLQRRRGPAESDQSFLDAAPHGHPQLPGPGPGRLLHTATPVSHPGGAVPVLAAGPDADLPAAQRFLGG